MSDETITNNEVAMENNTEVNQESSGSADFTSPEAQALLKSMVEDELSGMKENMNKMSKQRDEAMRKAVELEEGVKAAKLEKLEAEGKTSEALQMKLDEALLRLDAVNKVNTTLTRDHSVDKVLGDLQFRNGTAKDMAKSQIVNELKQDTEGGWVHATGAGLSEFVQAFAKDEENAFLFKPKQSSGAAAMQVGAADGSVQQAKSNTPITEQSFEDYLRNNQGPVNEIGF